jgi:hypothetical protein
MQIQFEDEVAMRQNLGILGTQAITEFPFGCIRCHGGRPVTLLPSFTPSFHAAKGRIVSFPFRKDYISRIVERHTNLNLLT